MQTLRFWYMIVLGIDVKDYNDNHHGPIMVMTITIYLNRVVHDGHGDHYESEHDSPTMDMLVIVSTLT